MVRRSVLTAFTVCRFGPCLTLCAVLGTLDLRVAVMGGMSRFGGGVSRCVQTERRAFRHVAIGSTVVVGHECQRQAPARWPATLHRGGVPRVNTWRRALGRGASAGSLFGVS